MIYSCRTYYSLKFGTNKPETLTKRAKELGITSLVISDINNTTGVFEFVKEKREESQPRPRTTKTNTKKKK